MRVRRAEGVVNVNDEDGGCASDESDGCGS